MNLFIAEFKVHSRFTENHLVPPTYSAAKLATVLLDRKFGSINCIHLDAN